MPDFQTHAMYPGATHDEQSRQNFIRTARRHVLGTVLGGAGQAYKARAKGAFEKAAGKPVHGPIDVLKAMDADAYGQMTGSLVRTTQEMLYDTVGPSIARQLPELVARSNAYAQSNRKRGSLMLDPNLALPRYHAAADIHCKPGAYHSEIVPDDVLAGAEYDRTINVFYMGSMGPWNDDMGMSLGTWIKKTYPDLKPKRILDMGCTIGHSTLPYCDLFPDAEIHAIDVAGPCLRYGHARAEAMGKTVHFAQMNAEKTPFPDGYFDLVLSHIMLHETALSPLKAIFRESHRLLAPGGVTAHVDARPFKDDPFDGYFNEWLAHYNNEPFMHTLAKLDLADIAAEAGFPRKAAFETRIPSWFNPPMGTLMAKEAGTWFTAVARKAG